MLEIKEILTISIGSLVWVKVLVLSPYLLWLKIRVEDLAITNKVVKFFYEPLFVCAVCLSGLVSLYKLSIHITLWVLFSTLLLSKLIELVDVTIEKNRGRDAKF